jgi:NAD(P)-dependent dehydrogenase (short-subunit alcohol dehydrogenase family)
MNAMFSLKGKVALVTGASSGIGLATGRRFQAAGARVFGVDRRPTGEEGFAVSRVDVADDAAFGEAFDEIARSAGGLDIVVNNAGIQPLGVLFSELSPSLIDKTLGINVRAVAMGHVHAARHLGSGGRILNTGSFVGLLGAPGGTVYAASKAAVIHLTRNAAVELAPNGITVNCVCPGTILTPAVLGIENNPEIPFVEKRTPLGRLGRPEEIAAAFHFLASEEAAYITGAILPVDGGITAGWERYDLVPPSNVVSGNWREES